MNRPIKISTRRSIGIVVLCILLIGMISFCGVYRDDEFGQKKFFIKHKPSAKLFFYSPRAMGDATLEDMLPQQKAEQILYDEYVPKRKWEFPLEY